MRPLYLILISLLLAAQTAQAQPAPTEEIPSGGQTVPLSMAACMDYALKHNYNIKNAQLDVLIQKAQNDQTLSASYPHINGKLELDDFLNPQQTFIDGSTFNPSVSKGTIQAFSFSLPYAASGGISGSQLLFDGGVFVAWKARKTVMEFARLRGEVTEDVVRLNVYKAYYALVIAYRQYDIIKKSLSNARAMQNDLAIVHRNGLAEKIEVERSEVQVNNLANDSVKVGNMLQFSEQMLKYQVGMDIKTPIVLTDTVLDQWNQNTLTLLQEEGHYEKVPEYNVVKTSLTLNEFNFKRYQLSSLPTLSIFGAMGYNYGENYLSKLFSFQKYTFNSMVGLQLNMPIFNGYMRHYQLTEARLNVEKSKNSIESVKQTIDFQAASSRTILKNAIVQVQNQRRNLDVANDVVDLAQKKYKAGVGSNIEVTQAQTDLLQSQNNYFGAMLELINAEAALKQALGLLK